MDDDISSHVALNIAIRIRPEPLYADTVHHTQSPPGSLYVDTIHRLQSQSDDHLSRLTLRALSWAVVTVRPLTVSELACGLPIHPALGAWAPVSQILRRSAGLLVQRDGAIQLAPDSALCDLLRRRLPAFHADLARACVAYLTMDPFREPCAAAAALHERLRTFPFFSYAARHWFWHFECALAGRPESSHGGQKQWEREHDLLRDVVVGALTDRPDARFRASWLQAARPLLEDMGVRSISQLTGAEGKWMAGLFLKSGATKALQQFYQLEEGQILLRKKELFLLALRKDALNPPIDLQGHCRSEAHVVTATKRGCRGGPFRARTRIYSVTGMESSSSARACGSGTADVGKEAPRERGLGGFGGETVSEIGYQEQGHRKQ